MSALYLENDTLLACKKQHVADPYEPWFVRSCHWWHVARQFIWPYQ